VRNARATEKTQAFCEESREPGLATNKNKVEGSTHGQGLMEACSLNGRTIDIDVKMNPLQPGSAGPDSFWGDATQGEKGQHKARGPGLIGS